MSIKTESLVVKVKNDNGEYIVDESGKEKKLHIGHIENVLNYYGKNGWILKQINPDETELHFYRNSVHWLKRFLTGNKIVRHRIRSIYEKGRKYDVGADTPFGEVSSTEDICLDSIKDVIEHLTSIYGYKFICQSPGKKIGDETLIKIYLYETAGTM